MTGGRAASAGADETPRRAPSRQPKVFARITEVTFTPDDQEDWPHPITVEWRGGENHCVKRGSLVWSERDEAWEYEPQPSSRDDVFIERTRYTYEQAMALATRLMSEQITGAALADKGGTGPVPRAAEPARNGTSEATP